ncbi:tRNA pseudouridine(55) synthase TruB [Ruminococcaceae bacterium OttesenSCG-928-D13]|nr:tRNA pseudouridine(55) synthase TruB [Ruminococcaceae bacterium OttesenSCG-928-D13]
MGGLNGILVVDKPAGFTSFDVVAKLRGICATRKIGHGGTLDPMATGVLPVFVGPAVKAVDLAPNQDKAYDAVMLLGTATDTGDITGTVLKTADAAHITAAEVAAVLPGLTGPQMQTPPMYSAVKVDGRPLYDYARKGQTVERKARPVTIYALDLMEQVEPPLSLTGANLYGLQVRCSKGTYVRTLLEEIGAALGVPATLAGLRRTQAGVFGLAQAHRLEEIQLAKDEGRLESLFTGAGELFAMLPAVEVDDTALGRLRNGAPVYRVKGEPGRCRVLHAGGFAGLGRVDEERTLRAEKLFLENDRA